MALVSVNVYAEGQGGNTATKYLQTQNPARLEVIDTADSAKIVSIRALVADDDSSAVVITVIPDQRDPGK